MSFNGMVGWDLLKLAQHLPTQYNLRHRAPLCSFLGSHLSCFFLVCLQPLKSYRSIVPGTGPGAIDKVKVQKMAVRHAILSSNNKWIGFNHAFGFPMGCRGFHWIHGQQIPLRDLRESTPGWWQSKGKWWTMPQKKGSLCWDKTISGAPIFFGSFGRDLLATAIHCLISLIRYPFWCRCGPRQSLRSCGSVQFSLPQERSQLWCPQGRNYHWDPSTSIKGSRQTNFDLCYSSRKQD